ncbi:MAG: hypothetical protein QG577_2280 [Thermodesulfobacteriota bacterium]|nr:hypothetical protein [Thermodesulfobacteriota bacterium]
MVLLVITATVLSSFLALTMAFFYASHKTFPGFGHWTFGGSLIAFGYLMMVLRGIVPVSLSIVLVNVAVPLSAVFYLDGMRRFLDLSEISRGWYAVPAVSALMSVVTFYTSDSAAWRSFFTSLAFSVPHLLTSALVFSDYPKTKSLFYLIIGTEMALASTVLMARAIWGFTVPDFQLMMVSPVEAGFFISLMVLQIVITVSFIMLNAERSNRDLQLAEAAVRGNLEKLEKALAEVKTLQGILPICANCKKIRDDRGDWVPMEAYVRDRTDADFSHGICPTCAKKLYPQFYKEKLV